MEVVIAVILGFTILDPPWSIIVIAVAVAWQSFEIFLFLKWRNHKTVTGREGMVGREGVIVTAAHPEGQARIKGQLWRVVCEGGADVGDYVSVSAVDGMRLRVEPTGRSQFRLEG